MQKYIKNNLPIIKTLILFNRALNPKYQCKHDNNTSTRCVTAAFKCQLMNR